MDTGGYAEMLYEVACTERGEGKGVGSAGVGSVIMVSCRADVCLERMAVFGSSAQGRAGVQGSLA